VGDRPGARVDIRGRTVPSTRCETRDGDMAPVMSPRKRSTPASTEALSLFPEAMACPFKRIDHPSSCSEQNR
jgi:hypothetical protein